MLMEENCIRVWQMEGDVLASEIKVQSVEAAVLAVQTAVSQGELVSASAKSAVLA